MAEHPLPWFPGANGAQTGTDGTDSTGVVELLAQADFLLSAVTDEIERSRDLRVGYWWLRGRRLRVVPVGEMSVLSGASMRGVLEKELEDWARRRTVALGEVEVLEGLPSDEAILRGLDGAQSWLKICERRHAAIERELGEWIRQHS